MVSEDVGRWVPFFRAGGGCARIEIPEPMCATVCFGSYDLKDLYGVTLFLGLVGLIVILIAQAPFMSSALMLPGLRFR